MAISNRTLSITEPAAVVAAENPIIFNVKTEQIGTDGYHSEQIIFTTGITNNYKIRITSQNSSDFHIFHTADFIAKNFPDASNYFLCNIVTDAVGNIVGYPTAAEIASSFATAVTADAYFSKNYYIGTSGHSVIITAKAATKNLDLGISRYAPNGSSTMTGTTIETLAEANSKYAGATIDGYSLYLDIYHPVTNIAAKQYRLGPVDTTTFVNIASLTLPFNPSNDHRFDVSDICKTFLSTSRPDPSRKLAWNEVDYIKPFFIKYGEIVPVVTGTNTKKKIEKGISDVFFAANASLPRTSANDFTAFTGTSENPVTGVNYLTNQPNPKKSSRNATEFLYLLIPADYVTTGDSVIVTASLTMWDGTTVNPAQLDNAAEIVFNQDGNHGCAYRLNVSYFNMGLDAYETGSTRIKNVWYRVYKNYTYQLGTDFHYRYPYVEADNYFNVCFQNALGTYDTFQFVGLREIVLERTKKDITTALEPDDDGSIEPGFKYNSVYDVTVTKRIVVNSGLIDLETFTWLQELIASNDIYQYDNSDLNYLRLENHKYSTNTNSNEYQIECTFLQTIHVNNVSR